MTSSYLHSLSPYVRYASDNKINTYFHIDRVIFDYEVLYIQDGTCTITIENQIYEGKAGDIFIFRPKVAHSILVEKGAYFHQPHIHFDLIEDCLSEEITITYKKLTEMNELEQTYFRNDINKSGQAHLPNRIQLYDTRHFEVLLYDIINTYNRRLPFYQEELKGKFIGLWTYLLRELFYQQNEFTNQHLQQIESIKDFIAENYNQNINLEDIEAKFALSKFAIIKLFKSNYNLTPMNYHKLIKIEKAKEMLNYTNMTVTEIADALNFTNIHTFSRTFKRITGSSPTKL